MNPPASLYRVSRRIPLFPGKKKGNRSRRGTPLFQGCSVVTIRTHWPSHGHDTTPLKYRSFPRSSVGMPGAGVPPAPAWYGSTPHGDVHGPPGPPFLSSRTLAGHVLVSITAMERAQTVTLRSRPVRDLVRDFSQTLCCTHATRPIAAWPGTWLPTANVRNDKEAETVGRDNLGGIVTPSHNPGCRGRRRLPHNDGL